MQILAPVLIIGMMWAGFFLVKLWHEVGKYEFGFYVFAALLVIVLTGYYYSIFTALWCGFSAFTGAGFSFGLTRKATGSR